MKILVKNWTARDLATSGDAAQKLTRDLGRIGAFMGNYEVAFPISITDPTTHEDDVLEAFTGGGFDVEVLP